ncbi:uncharacterized [Tachysurus ichikawai]
MDTKGLHRTKDWLMLHPQQTSEPSIRLEIHIEVHSKSLRLGKTYKGPPQVGKVHKPSPKVGNTVEGKFTGYP